MTLSTEHLERIRYRLEAAEKVDKAMFPGSFGTYYLEDVKALLNEIEVLTPEFATDAEVPVTTVIGA